MSKVVNATVIVTRDDMVYMVQRVVANIEDMILSQIFLDKVYEGIKKVADVDDATITSTKRFISVPVTVTIDDNKETTEEDITSVLASRIYNNITEGYKVASVLVATDSCESIACSREDGTTVVITKQKTKEAESFENSLTTM